MKKALSILTLLCVLGTLFASPAMAQASAIPNQRLSFRTGPSTRYTELFTLPESTHIVPLAYEEGNGVTWVLCEFQYNGELYQGYTGLKRMEVRGNVPWAEPFFAGGIILNTTPVYSAPSTSAAQYSWLSRGESVMLLQSDYDTEGDTIPYEGLYLDFSLDYAYIEYYDTAAGAPARGWVSEYDIATIGTSAGYVTQDSAVYSEDLKNTIGVLKQNELVSITPQMPKSGCAEIYFYDRETSEHTMGYIPFKNLHTYK